MGIIAPSPISDKHDISGFDCGHKPLNEWLQKRAIKNESSGASRTFVTSSDYRVIGYYSLAVGAISREESSGRVRRNMPDPTPVMILGRLAVDREWQGKRVGVGMLKDAFIRTLVVAEQAGIRALLVHALSEEAKTFYLQWGFHESPINPMTLMITLNEAKRAVAS